MPRRSGTFTDEEVALLGTNSDRAIARRLGRAPKSVEQARRYREIPPFVEYRHVWSKRELALLGKHSDAEVARRIGRSRVHVTRERLRLGIRAKHQERTRKSSRQD